MRVYQRLYHRVFQRVSSPSHPAVSVGCSVSCFPSPAWGCKGRSSLRSSAPCPHAVPVMPLDPSRSPDARTARYGVGARGCRPCTPRPLGPPGPRSALRCGGGKLAPSMLVVLFLLLFGHPADRLPFRVAQTEALWCVPPAGRLYILPPPNHDETVHPGPPAPARETADRAVDRRHDAARRAAEV